MKQTIVSIVMGSDSDLPVMQRAAKILEEFEIPFEIKIVSAHRTPEFMFNYAKNVQTKGIKIIIAGAGGAAHLPGMIAAITALPVIGVPVKSKSMSGLDSLYSIVQMPPGVPVATVAINGAYNAGLLAIEILAIADKGLLDRLTVFRAKQSENVIKKSSMLIKTGYKNYLKDLEAKL